MVRTQKKSHPSEPSIHVHPGGTLIAFGDVHGCVHPAEVLLPAIRPTANDRLVFLGDLIDHGHDTRDALDAFWNWSGSARWC